MTEYRLTHLLLHVHKQETAKLDMDTIFEEFAGRNAERRNVFGVQRSSSQNSQAWTIGLSLRLCCQCSCLLQANPNFLNCYNGDATSCLSRFRHSAA